MSRWKGPSPSRPRDYIAAADLEIVEGTTSLFDAPAARTPVVMVPGPIFETWWDGTGVNEEGAGVVMRPERVTHVSMARRMRGALESEAARGRTERLLDLVGRGGRDLAVATIRRVNADRVRVGTSSCFPALSVVAGGGTSLARTGPGLPIPSLNGDDTADPPAADVEPPTVPLT